MANLFIGIALWTPCIFWGYYVAHTDGRTSFSEATIIEWAVLWVLAIAPYFVITKIKIKDDE